MAKKTNVVDASKTQNEADAAGFEPNMSRAVDLVMQLMPIRGGSGDELAVANFIIDRLKKAGASADAIEIDNANKSTPLAGNVGNLIFKLPGTIKAPRRMLTAHMDTVPICIGSQPKRDGNFVRSADPKTGLGADNRSGSATILSAALEILERKLPHPPLTFCWFIQEEIGLYGARFVQKSLLGKPKLAFNWDGGSPTKLTVGATGGYRMEIEVRGIASHAGVAPQRGVSAIAIAGLAIADLHREGWHGDIHKAGKHGTSNIGIIKGGDATNVVTDYVYLKAEARSHDPKFRERIVTQIERSFQKAAKEVKNEQGQRGSVSFQGRLDYESFRLADDEPSVLAAEQSIRSLGGEPVRAISNGGLDANWLALHGIPAVTLGSGQMNAHMTSETLDIAAYETACRIALRLATGTEEAK